MGILCVAPLWTSLWHLSGHCSEVSRSMAMASVSLRHVPSPQRTRWNNHIYVSNPMGGSNMCYWCLIVSTYPTSPTSAPPLAAPGALCRARPRPHRPRGSSHQSLRRSTLRLNRATHDDAKTRIGPSQAPIGPSQAPVSCSRRMVFGSRPKRYKHRKGPEVDTGKNVGDYGIDGPDRSGIGHAFLFWEWGRPVSFFPCLAHRVHSKQFVVLSG